MWCAAGNKGTFNDRSFWDGGEDYDAAGKGMKGKGKLSIKGKGGHTPYNPGIS